MDERYNFEALYKQLFPYAQGYMAQRGCVGDNFEEVFQESFIALTRNLQNGQFRGQATLQTYFIQICRNKWADLKGAQDITPSNPPEKEEIFPDRPIELTKVSECEDMRRIFRQAVKPVLSTLHYRILMCQMEDMENKGIADLLSEELTIARQTVLNNCALARQALTNFIQQNPKWKAHLSLYLSDCFNR
jgi:DNA-directed RNA polymerase specialized sigma24 family protein